MLVSEIQLVFQLIFVGSPNASVPGLHNFELVTLMDSDGGLAISVQLPCKLLRIRFTIAFILTHVFDEFFRTGLITRFGPLIFVTDEVNVLLPARFALAADRLFLTRRTVVFSSLLFSSASGSDASS